MFTECYTLIEGALAKVGDKWEAQSADISKKMEAMLALQQAHLELDRARLEFETEKAGLPLRKKPRKIQGTYTLLSQCRCIKCLSLSSHHPVLSAFLVLKLLVMCSHQYPD